MTDLQRKLEEISPARDAVYSGNVTEKTSRALMLGLYEALQIIAGPVGGEDGDDDGAEADDTATATAEAPKGKRKAKVTA